MARSNSEMINDIESISPERGENTLKAMDYLIALESTELLELIEFSRYIEGIAQDALEYRIRKIIG